ncbi:diguanylate cyclase/phosphodiesterase [Pseudomonas chlororaphis subsp. piscium]|uniref:DNA-binding protein n=1 Tax=Pseudomonas chlororaphis TaxID=587753 RepID=UPI000F57C813|nr:DNA-binding protein [Pseudomonas chlororaphis]AZC76054.1 diguanylate cyclase/phosphodiesterase [Pseudomonas chlororaphis subsp. piscium]
MAVGVPENDVFAAADAVLARGERPTVERVRLELGRGSPARVGALLDQWWEQLAGRLRGETRLPGLPTEVAQAFVAIWQQATLLAQGVAEQALAAQRQVLMEEREQLAAEQEQLRQEAARGRLLSAEAVAARQATETRLGDLEQLLEQRLTQIDDLRQQREQQGSQMDEARQDAVALRQQLQDSRALAEQLRLDQERYTQDVENRAFREIDRAREETKGLAALLKEANAQLQLAHQALQTNQTALTEAREQGAETRAQAIALRPQVEQWRQVAAQAEEQLQAVQQRLQVTQAELGTVREHAAAAQARAETLEQHLKQQGAVASHERPPRARKAPSKDR